MSLILSFSRRAWTVAGLLFGLLSFAPNSAHALDPNKSIYQFNCQSWTRQNGLPANNVVAVAQTKEGYIWLGTQNGLVRFDGWEFKAISITSPLVRGGSIKSIFPATKGGLYFTNQSGGFYFYDGQNVSVAGDPRWADPKVNAMLMIEARNGDLWAATNLGWGRWANGQPDQTIFNESEEIVTMSLWEDTSGGIWRGLAQGGVWHWANGKWTRLEDDYLEKRYVTAITTDAEGRIWIGTEKGLRCYDAQGRVLPLSPLIRPVKALLIDRHGILWIATEGFGLFRYQDGNYASLKKIDGLSSDFLTSLAEDREGSLWIGTRDGLSQLSDLKFPIYTEKEGLTIGATHAVFPARNHGVWISGDGLSRLDGKTAINFSSVLGEINPYLKAGYEARDGRVYLVDGDKNIVVLSESKIVAVYPNQTWPQAFAEDDVSVIVGIAGGLFRIDASGLRPYSFLEGKIPAISWVNNLWFTRDQSLWVASDNGLFRIKDGQTTSWSMAEGLPGDKVDWVSEDIDGSIWAGLPLGIVRIKNGRLSVIHQSNGLIDNRTYAIVPDDFGYFWVSSGRGIYRVARQALNEFADGKLPRVKCEPYDGLESIKFSDRTTEQNPSGCKTADGRIYFPNLQGVVMINPADFFVNKVAPPVYIQEIKTEESELKEGKSAKLRAGDRRAEFFFTALSYISPKKIQIRYQLEGVDPTWVEAGSRRSVRYDELRPGRYRFRVQACNADGVWNLTGDEFTIEVPPVYYETIWFRILCLFALGLVLFGGFSRMIRNLRARQKKLQAENDLLEERVAKRTAELAREYALLRALLDNSPDQIYFKDKKSCYLKASRALADNIGAKSPEQLIGKSDFDFFAPEHAETAYRDEQEIIRTGRPVIGKIEKEVWADGRVSWVLTNKLPLRNDADEIIGTFGTSRSITAIKEAEARLQEVHNELVETSRQAGMAEVAASVLHNVGNVLNSVNVSSILVTDQLRNSKLPNLAKVGAMVLEHQNDLAFFLTNTPQGQRLPVYIKSLTDHLVTEHGNVLAELKALCTNIEHIKDIVATHQSYAKISGVREKLEIVTLVEDALRIKTESLNGQEVKIVRDFKVNPTVVIDKHKVMQILVNLLKNAKDACQESERMEKTINVQISERDGRIRILVNDNGVGIPPENLTRIFGFGFTTRKNGHGFGLHSGALAARELGGSLVAQSEGAGKGATFILEIPCS